MFSTVHSKNDLLKQMGHNQKLLWLLIGNPLLETFDQPIDIIKEIFRAIKSHDMFDILWW